MLSDSVGENHAESLEKPGENGKIFKRKMYHGNEAIHIINHTKGLGQELR
jgi:hypothetical protein